MIMVFESVELREKRDRLVADPDRDLDPDNLLDYFIGLFQLLTMVILGVGFVSYFGPHSPPP